MRDKQTQTETSPLVMERFNELQQMVAADPLCSKIQFTLRSSRISVGIKLKGRHYGGIGSTIQEAVNNLNQSLLALS